MTLYVTVRVLIQWGVKAENKTNIQWIQSFQWVGSVLRPKSWL